MGLIKAEMFTEEQNQLSLYFKAFGHPARVAIIQHLFKINTCVCGDLVDVIGLAQPTISQHLKELKKLGLIQGTIEGTSVCYCINQDNWTKMKNTLTAFLDTENNTNTCC
ncbi:DNA-binding transcriptional ArsR family regulator [Mesoflavibacter sabulilitoris]|uniref:Transcriptional regulator n=1 Tax=Mesoflavibacter zeaxanthinifaciens subsp. sabulilitoris TaxID=1520893 RepID=A0A2T1NHB6_9FLAO|nr:metalloregulator ArsR/SmtB family transcription factor [Mesoflavibacter zeaxanthinifaciens]MBB3122674.1 DNA-binding transcriptional ArsR family regulator [Mesoflavibacter zeaxanthinifaciens subsp. sabulilitoris]PSG92235.1 transcriptional regulator [Mesoflavibacter zeaxanthinifaciens subsp. sabulilitoris]